MDFAVLEAKEAYRNWINLGLKNFFVSQEVAEGLSAERSAGLGNDQRRAGSRPVVDDKPGRDGEQEGQPFGRRLGKTSPHHDSGAGDSARGGQSRSGVGPGPRSAPVSGADLSMAPEGMGSGPCPGPGDEPDWKAVWRRYRPKLATPVKTIWTYWNLGNDMGGRREPKRKELFANMIKALAWPRGSIGFWPVSFQHRGKLLPRRELFVKGLRESGAHTVICFGQRAFNVLFPDEIFDYKTMTIGDVTVIVVPGPGPMLGADGADAKRAVWRTLSAYKP